MSRFDRDEARWIIIRAANRQKLSRPRPFPAVLFGMRQIQQAVCVARRNRLVDGETLRLAGFREKAR